MAKKTLYIPEGIPNIASLFPGVDLSTVEEWSVQLKDAGNNILATTRTNKIGCCCSDEKIRIHFINSCGEVDSINFSYVTESEDVKSDTWEKSLRSPLDKTKGGAYRRNIRSNESVEAQTTCYSETDQYWIKELFESPLAWIEQMLPRGFNAPDTKQYITIRILDSKFLVRKREQRYEYLVTIKYDMANSNINLR